MGGEPAFGVVAKATSWFGLIDYTNSCALAPSGEAHFEHARWEREKKENRLGDRGEGKGWGRVKKKKKKKKKKEEGETENRSGDIRLFVDKVLPASYISAGLLI